MTTVPDHTNLFLTLSPDVVLQAVEDAGIACASTCFPLNSFENRVYLMETLDGRRVVSKFYRPLRWTPEQILEEHAFLRDLSENEVPICPVLAFPDGTTLKQINGISYCLFEARGGRAPDELTDGDADRLGMLVGRIHSVGASREATHRVRLSAQSYIHDNLTWLDEHGTIPATLAGRYVRAAHFIADDAAKRLANAEVQRIHGDCHLGNFLLRDDVFHVLDFDDMVVGPPVQDVWLAVPGRDTHARRQREAFLEGYERFRPFDRDSLDLIEPLRGMRLIHYATWLAKRWHDPIFPRTWPHFGTEEYWLGEVQALEEIVDHIEQQHAPRPNALDEPPLTNEDYFWDLES